MSQTVLVLVAHHDDAEIGCGGTLYQHVGRGDRVFLAVLIDSPLAGSVAVRNEEQVKAAGRLGIPAENVIFAETVRHGSFAQLPPFYDIVDRIVWDVKPDMVYTHYERDTHQEHRAVSQVVQAVCRPTWITSIAFFEGVTSLDFQPNYWNPLTDEAYQAKIDALHLHCSQVERWVRGGLRLEQVVAALSSFRGSQVGCQAAESFVLFRQIGIAIPQPEVVTGVAASVSPAVPSRKNGSEAHDYTQIRNTVL